MLEKPFLVAQREFTENLRTKTFWIGIFVFPVILTLGILVPAWLESARDVRHYAVVDDSGWLLQEVERRATAADLTAALTRAAGLLAAGDRAAEELPPELSEAAAAAMEAAGALEATEPEDEPAGAATPSPGDPGAPGEMESAGVTSPDRAPLSASGGADMAVDPTTGLAGAQAAEEQPALVRVIEGFAQAVAGQGSAEGTDAAEAPADMPPEVAGDELPEPLAALPQEKRLALLAHRAPLARWWEGVSPKEADDLAAGLARARYRRVEVATAGPGALEDLNRRIADEDLFAYFVFGPEPVAGNEGFRYVSVNLTDTDLREWISGLASDAVRERRLAREGIEESVARWVQEPVRFEARKVSAAGAEEEVRAQDLLRQWAPVAFVYLLWIAVFTVSQMLLTNTVEEKSNRIIEVLLSSVSPLQLMAGKLAGIAATGLTVVGSWVVFFVAAVNVLPRTLDAPLEMNLTSIAADPLYLGSFVVYFFLGYLFFASVLVGLGSVCNSLKEAQNLMAPVTMLLMVPLFAMIPVGRDPNGTLARVLSFIPPFTPFVMMNRAAGPPSLMEYALTTLLLLASIALTLWAAAKVFRVGILMTGKRPGFREILKWVRAPVGQVAVRVEPEGPELHPPAGPPPKP